VSRTALRVTGGPAVGSLIVVDDELRVGSAEGGEGALGGDDALSPAHAVLTKDHMGDWLVRDLDSEAGTFLNGQPVRAVAQIHRGDTLRVGASRLLVVEGATRVPREPTAAVATQHTVLTFPEPARTPLPPPPPPAPVKPATPEPQIARLWHRFCALVVDNLLLGPVAIALWFAFDGAAIVPLAMLAVGLIYEFLCESLRGQSIGKRAMKIRVVRRDGTRLRPQHCAARNVLRFIDNVFISVPCLLLTGRKRRQRLGDLAAGTIVVRSDPAKAKLPPELRDRLILAAYPVAWIVPLVIYALLNPAVTASDCVKAGITTAEANEGTCLSITRTGEREVVTYANVGHSLHWSGYRIQLEATRVRRLTRPDNVAVLALKLSVTNGRSTPARFDRRSVNVELTYPYLGGLRWARALHKRHLRPIAPGDVQTRWVQFVVPVASLQDYVVGPKALDFQPSKPGADLQGGVLRLWKAATPEGAQAALPRAA
jgi:uncharacterized RDD family membrane protein YckC